MEDHSFRSSHEGQADLSAVGPAKENANTRTLRPDKCLVVKSLESRLPTVVPSQHGIHRHHHQGVEGRNRSPLLGCQFFYPLSRRGIRPCYHSLSAVARGGNSSLAADKWKRHPISG